MAPVCKGAQVLVQNGSRLKPDSALSTDAWHELHGCEADTQILAWLWRAGQSPVSAIPNVRTSPGGDHIYSSFSRG